MVDTQKMTTQQISHFSFSMMNFFSRDFIHFIYLFIILRDFIPFSMIVWWNFLFIEFSILILGSVGVGNQKLHFLVLSSNPIGFYSWDLSLTFPCNLQISNKVFLKIKSLKKKKKKKKKNLDCLSIQILSPALPSLHDFENYPK